MHAGEARQCGHILVDAGIVFHGAGTQGVEAAVDTVDTGVELRVVTGHVHFRHLRQGRSFGAGKLRGQFHRFHIALGEDVAVPAGNTLFKDQFHFASTSFTMAAARSRSHLLTFSVAHHSTPSFTGKPPRIPASSSALRTSSCFGRVVTNSWKYSPV